MFSKLLCAVVLASAVLAQDVSIALPVAGTKVKAGSPLTIQLQSQTSSAVSEEVALVIAASTCLGGCPDPHSGLGTVLYTGQFKPQATNSAGKVYQNITVNAPNWFTGTGLLSVAHFYLLGIHNTAELQLTSTTVDITGSSG